MEEPLTKEALPALWIWAIYLNMAIWFCSAQHSS